MVIAPPAPAPIRKSDDERKAIRLPLGLTPVHIGVLASGFGAFVLIFGLLIGPTTALIAFAALVGGVVVATAIVKPSVALGIMLVSEYANLSGVFEKYVPGSIYLATLGLSILSVAVALCRRKYRSRLRRNWWVPAALLTAYSVSEIPATLFTQATDETANSLDGSLKNILFITVILLLMQMSDRPWMIASSIVIPLALLCVLMAVNQYVLNNSTTLFGFSNIQSLAGASIATPRHAGPLPDSNYWGRFLVMGFPLAMALAHRAAAAKDRLRCTMWIVAVLCMGGGIYLTQSRGTQLGIGAAVVVWVIATGPAIRRKAMYLTPLLLLGLLVPGVGDRLLTLTETLTGPSYAADESLVERTNLQQVAFKIFQENPIFGAGPGSFGVVLPKYAPLSSAGSTGGVTSPHTLYLQILSESGIVGMLGWLVFIGGTMWLALRAAQRLGGARDDGLGGRPSRALAAAALASVVGFSVASISLHISYARTLLLICAFAGYLYSAVRADPRLDTPLAQIATRRMRDGFRFGMVATIATAIAASIVAATLLSALSRTTYVAETVLVLKVTEGVGNWEGYLTDIRRRPFIMPTFAGTLQGTAQPGTTVIPDPTRGIMTVHAEGSSPSEAEARRNKTVDGAITAYTRAGILGSFTPGVLEVKPVTQSAAVTDGVIRIVLIATLVEIAVVVTLCTRIRRQERRQGTA
ncbi:O-antigen ligase family protein [Pseudonocardia sp. TRM90224]|uniref:O-antigen ligase family protein n=1 Tax=Pseudonocardia sp. TRM90224 TaxID=2812678 RepID=UPI001E29CF5C|nr:O-antigen ligase family protein [Pseudonocardia sp. TRM90224]